MEYLMEYLMGRMMKLVEILFDAGVMPKLKSHIKFKLQDKDWQNAKILSKQPKRTGVNKDWMNIHVDG